MGLIRKVAIVSTGGLARAAINPNSKKARIAKATERSYKLERDAERSEAIADARLRRVGAAPAGGRVLVADEILKLARLRDAGELTPAEFAAQKARVLGA